MSLAARLMILVGLAMLPAFVLVVAMTIEDRRDRTALAYDEVRRVVQFAVAQQSQRVDAARDLLMKLSEQPEVWTPNDPRCSTRLRATFHTFSAYANLGVVRPDGEAACAAVPTETRGSFADRKWFQQALATRRMAAAGVPRGRVQGLPLIVVAMPLVKDGEVRGVAYAGLRLDWLPEVVRHAQLGRDATVAVVDARGTVMTHNRDGAGWIARDLGAAPLTRSIASGRQGTTDQPGPDGIRRFYAFAPLGQAEHATDLYLAIGTPSGRILGSANTVLARNVLLLALAAALSAALAWSVATRLVLNTVRGLAAAARRLGEGDLTARVRPWDREGELAELGQAFDQMADALCQRDAALRAAAAERRTTDARLSWAAIAEASQDAIIGIDADGAVFSWNAGAGALLGPTAAEAMGRPVATLVPEEWTVELRAVLDRVRRGERVNDLELVGARPDGARVEVSCALSPIQDGRSGVSLIARDIAERRRAGARLRAQSAALEAAANGIVITDVHGTIEWVNPAFTAMTGYTRNEAIGRTPRILKSGHHDAAFYKALWATVLDGRVWRHEMVNRRKDGTCYHEEQTITPVLDEGGRITRFVAIKHDVTERRRAAEALRRSEEHFRSLIDNARDMILVLDEHGIVRYASPSVERVTGYRPEELVGNPALARVHPDDRDAVRAVLAIPGFSASVQYRAMCKDGSWQTIEAVGKKMATESDIVRIVINARDITDRTRLQEQLAQTEKLAAMANLLAGVAHELNNPLSIVTGHATLLERAAAGTEMATRAAKIAAAAKRCARIVKSFLALARQRAPERTAVDLGILVRETLEMMAYSLRVDDVEVVFDLADEIPPVQVDAHQIQQVLVNLVTNAHQAMRETTGPRRLTIAVRPDGAARQVTLTVSDTGPGLPPEVRKRLFEPFFTTKPVGQGTGLGLSICKGIVESHGGRIDVASPAQGAAFAVVLPLDVWPARTSPEEVEAPPLTARSVLVVDDEPDVTSVLVELLAADGHVVEAASDGREALAKIEAGAYDAILSDVKMPGLDGPGLYREVARRDPDLARRFMFITGDTLDPGTARFLEETGLPSFAKPFGPDVTRRALAAITLMPRAAVGGSSST
jgi:PAS domain S-box-containing protein